MTKSLSLALLAFAFAISMHADPALAQRARVFVSINGNDTGGCTATIPCRTFAYAETQVLAGGEISVLDTGGYGTIVITKALSIVATGVEASIALTSGQTAISVQASATDKVALRGLTLDGQGVGQTGIQFISGASLTVEDCVVRNMSADGLFFVSAGSTLQTLSVSNSYFNDNGAYGIGLATASVGAVNAAIDRTVLFGNGDWGLHVDAEGASTSTLTVAVTDSVAASNVGPGFYVTSNGIATSNLSLTRSLAQGNGIGIQADKTGATLWFAQSTLTGNTVGYATSAGGVIKTYSDNNIDASNGAESGSLTAFAKQ